VLVRDTENSRSTFLNEAFPGADPILADHVTAEIADRVQELLSSISNAVEAAYIARESQEGNGTHDPPQLPFEVLERLLVVAFRTVRVDEDAVRPSGEVYSPDDRDRAQRPGAKPQGGLRREADAAQTPG
jgi:hypothetical protein